MPTFTTHSGRHLTPAEVRAEIMRELRRWRDTWPAVVGTLKQRQSAALAIVAECGFHRLDGCVARPCIGDYVLDYVVGVAVGNVGNTP